MTQILALVVGGYLALVGALYIFQRSLLYHPGTSVPVPAESRVPEMTPVEITTADGLDLTAWYRPPEHGKPVIIYFHGNAGNIGDRGYKARRYLDAGFGVLLASYRGYGGNPGSPSEAGLFADARAALAFLAGTGVEPGRWVLYGESLGSGVAVAMAAEQALEIPVGAVVLEAPFTSITDLAAAHYPFVPARYLIKDHYESAAVIGGVWAPVLVFHGTRDRTVPVRFGRALFALARDPKESRWIEGASHNDLYDFGAADTVIDFLGRRLPGQSAPGGGGAPP